MVLGDDYSSDIRMAYHDLLSFGKVITRIAVQLKFAQSSKGNNVLGDNLSWVKEVEAESQLVLFVHDLGLEL
jgi:hypothetical protein